MLHIDMVMYCAPLDELWLASTCRNYSLPFSNMTLKNGSSCDGFKEGFDEMAGTNCHVCSVKAAASCKKAHKDT